MSTKAHRVVTRPSAPVALPLGVRAQTRLLLLLPIGCQAK